MKLKVKDIGNISSGVYVKTLTVGNVYYLQGRDFDDYKRLRKDVEPCAAWTGVLDKHILNTGDVLVAAKGNDNFAAMYCGKVSPAVASSMFLVIRDIDHCRILPEFLAWQINHSSRQSYLRMKSKGTSITSINKSVLGDMVIDIPTIEKQRAVLSLSELRFKEKKLLDELSYYKNLRFERNLLNAIN